MPLPNKNLTPPPVEPSYELASRMLHKSTKSVGQSSRAVTSSVNLPGTVTEAEQVSDSLSADLILIDDEQVRVNKPKGAEGKGTILRKDLLKQQFSNQLSTSLPSNNTDTKKIVLVKKIHLLENQLEALTLELKREVQNFNFEGAGLVIAHFENRLAAANLEHQSVSKTIDGLNIPLNNLSQSSIKEPSSPLQKATLLCTECQEQLNTLNRLYSDRQQKNVAEIAEVKSDNHSCCSIM